MIFNARLTMSFVYEGDTNYYDEDIDTPQKAVAVDLQEWMRNVEGPYDFDPMGEITYTIELVKSAPKKRKGKS